MTAPMDPSSAAAALPVPATPALRAALGRFATGVTIITCRAADGLPIGLTANSLASLSLDPPLLLWSLRKVSPSVAAFDAAQHFAVNVLAESQVELSRRFASSVADKFAEGHWLDGLGRAPVLAMYRRLCRHYWDIDPAGSDGMDGMDGANGMMSDDEMDMMSEAMGADLDRMFLETMIRHHQGAIRMAEVELEEGSNADVLALAQGIIDGQQAEIDQMQSMLEDT